MKAYIEITIDYTLKRKGDKIFTIADGNQQFVNAGGCWKTKKACMTRLQELGFEYIGTYTVHQNYGHWADFQFAK